MFPPTGSRSPCPAAALPLHTPPRAAPILKPPAHALPWERSSTQALLPAGPGCSLQHTAKGSWDKLAELWMPAQAGQGRYEPAAGRISRCLPALHCCSPSGSLLQGAARAHFRGGKGISLLLSPEEQAARVSPARLCLQELCLGETSADGTRRPTNPLAAPGLYLCFLAGSRVKTRSAHERERCSSRVQQPRALDCSPPSMTHSPAWHHPLAEAPVIWGFAPQQSRGGPRVMLGMG